VSSVFTSVDPLRAALDYHLDRQNVLASNVAHVDTPGYRPNDLERVDQTGFTAALGLAMTRTNENHLVGGALERATPGASPSACPDPVPLTPTLMSCDVAFPAREGTATLSFSHGGGQRLWHLDPASA